jgi:hypothetical protein
VDAAIVRDVNQAIVGAGPDQTFPERRFGDGEDRIVVFDAAVVLGDLAAGRTLLGAIVAGEVGA